MFISRAYFGLFSTCQNVEKKNVYAERLNLEEQLEGFLENIIVCCLKLN